jgi:hypothetical protein
MNEPRCHGTSLDADPRIRAGSLHHRARSLLGSRDTLAPPQAMTVTVNNAHVVIFCETSKPT